MVAAHVGEGPAVGFFPFFWGWVLFGV